MIIGRVKGSQSIGAGDLFLGKYRIERVLGEGNSGTVFSARHLELDDLVAIKVLKPDLDDVAIERFIREARLTVKIRNDHVARVHDVARMDDGSAYMVMEHLDGDDLHRVLTTEGALPIAEAVEFVLQASEALGDAHALGVVHRDVKPANLFRVAGPDGTRRIKLLDFGIARSVAGSGEEGSLTSSLALLGSPRYMAPEQIKSSRTVDLRADIWGLGVTLFELLGASPPFKAANLVQLCARIQYEPPCSLLELRPDVPRELEAIVMRCLAKDPAERFANTKDLVHALAPFCSLHADAEAIAPTLPAPLLPTPSPVAVFDESTIVQPATSPAPRRLRPADALWLLLLPIAALPLLLGLRARSHPEGSPSRDPAPQTAVPADAPIATVSFSLVTATATSVVVSTPLPFAPAPPPPRRASKPAAPRVTPTPSATPSITRPHAPNGALPGDRE